MISLYRFKNFKILILIHIKHIAPFSVGFEGDVSMYIILACDSLNMNIDFLSKQIFR